MSIDQLSTIVSTDPEILGGAQVFLGTRVPVRSLFAHLAAGESIDDFLEGFSTVKRQQVMELLEFCARDVQTAAA
jgi:uncharacterized protein (DUF433 family)